MFITEKLIEIISNEFKIDPETLNSDTNLVYDLELDSIDLVYLWYEIEASFGILIPDDFQISTIEVFANYIESMGVNYEKTCNQKSDFNSMEDRTENWFNTSSNFTL